MVEWPHPPELWDLVCFLPSDHKLPIESICHLAGSQSTNFHGSFVVSNGRPLTSSRFLGLDLPFSAKVINNELWHPWTHRAPPSGISSSLRQSRRGKHTHLFDLRASPSYSSNENLMKKIQCPSSVLGPVRWAALSRLLFDAHHFEQWNLDSVLPL